MLAALGIWALLPLAAALLDVWRHGGLLGGGEGFGVIDHYQYMGWIREAGEHLLASNRFDVDGDDPVYLQPMWLVSGLGWRAGLPIQLAFLLWKPVAVGLLAWGYLAYVRRLVAGAGRRVVALALALLYLAPLNAVVHGFALAAPDTREWAGLFAYELAPAMYTWGYYPAAIAAGLTPLFLLAIERALAATDRRYAWGATSAGSIAAWVHPWQGAVLILLLGVAAVWAWRVGAARRALPMLALPAAALALPLAYYLALGRWDADWDRAAGELWGPHHWRSVALVVTPLALAAIGGWWASRRRAPLDLQEVLLPAWPLAILALYVPVAHENVLQGLSLPLAVLAVRLWPRRTPHAAAVAAGVLAVATLPGAAYALDKLRDSVAYRGFAMRLLPGEAAALRHLDGSRRAGPVLTRFYLGEAVPAHTGRMSYIGHPIWTPDLGKRERAARDLLAGRMSAAQLRALVRATGAAFVLADCRLPAADLRRLLAGRLERTRRFGCATVYELRR